jgi:hypothetical protein
VTPGLPLGLQPCNPFCFGRQPKARVATHVLVIDGKIIQKLLGMFFYCTFNFFPSLEDKILKKNNKKKIKGKTN